MRTLLVAIGLVLAISGTASASFVEDTTGLCWENDGSEELSADCDFPDSIGALLASPLTESNCNTKPTQDDGHTYGTLVPPHNVPNVPQEDPTDFCYAQLYPNVEAGARVQFTLALANDVDIMSVSLHLWDVETGTPIPFSPPEAADGPAAASTSEASADGLPFGVHSGVSPFHPISVSEVLVDGESRTSQSKATLEIAQLDFVVKNDPQVITIDGTGHDLHTGDAVRLCDYSGQISFALTELGGNIKLDGAAVGFAVAPDGLAALPTCTAVVLDPACDTDAEGNVYRCQLNVSASEPIVVLEARAHGPSTQAGLVQSKPMRCHSLCTVLGVDDPFPSDWFLDLDQLSGASPS